jgi:hypothetical protein
LKVWKAFSRFSKRGIVPQPRGGTSGLVTDGAGFFGAVALYYYL